jgi:nucleotide-binding universal stress UspA family protein
MSTKDKEQATNAGIRRILCATDLSGNCDHIYSYALDLAAERNAGLMVIHVISHRSIKAAKTLAYYLNESQKDVVREKTTSALHRMKTELSAFLEKEIKIHPHYPDLVEHLLVYPGQVADEIVEKANRFGCEAIVLGARGSGGLKRLFRRATAKKIISQTPKPVFLVSLEHGKLAIAKYNPNGSAERD